MSNLNPQQFKNTYKPSEYADTWEGVPHSEEFHAGIKDDEWPHDQLVENVRKRGVQIPVGVHRGYVVDGHHRVAAALEAGVSIPVEHWASELYEGQIPE